MSNNAEYITKEEILKLYPELTNQVFETINKYYIDNTLFVSDQVVYLKKEFKKFYEKFRFINNLKTLQAAVSLKASEYENSLIGKATIIPTLVQKELDKYINYYKANPLEHEKLKENISQYFISNEYKNIFFKLNSSEIESKLLSEETVKKFLLEKFDFSKDYNANKRLDFYSIFIGFSGWVNAVSKKFTLPVTQDSLNYDTLTNKIDLSLQNLNIIERRISDLTSNQNLNHDDASKEISSLFTELRKQSKSISSIKLALNKSTTSKNDAILEKISKIEQQLIETTLSINDFQNGIESSTNHIIDNQNVIYTYLKTVLNKNFRSLKIFGGVIAGVILIVLLVNTFIPKSDIQIKGLFDEKFEGFVSDSTTFKLLVMPFNRDRISNSDSKANIENQFLRRFNKIKKGDSLNIEIAFLKTESPPSDEYDIIPILKEYTPDMVIWGNYEETSKDETKIAINYSISSDISLSLGIPKDMQTNLTPINSMESIRNGKLQGDIDNIIFWIVANYHFKKNEFNKSYLALKKIKEKKGFEYHYNLLRYLVSKKTKNETDSKIFFPLAVKSIKNHPTKDLIQKYNELATILAFEKNMVNSLLYFTKSLKINPNDNYALKSIGMILTHEKEYEMAENALLKSIKLNEKDAHTWYLLGITYVYNKKNKEAGTAFQIAAQLNPKLKSFFKEFIKNKDLRISDVDKVFK